MKLSKRTTTAIGCLWLVAGTILIILQIVFPTMKLAGAVDWSWWTTLIPIFCVLGLPLAIVVIAVIVLAPKVLIEDRRRRKRVEAEAKKYGMERKPGESTGELKKRIVQRNMITGNYSRKEIKDAVLEAFPELGSCQFFTDNQNDVIVMIPRRSDDEDLTDVELKEVAEFAAQFIPVKYTLKVKRPEEVSHGNTET